MKIFKSFFAIFVVLFFITACENNREEPTPPAFTSRLITHLPAFPHFNELRFENVGRGYEFKNETSNKLIIALEGGGFASVIQTARMHSTTLNAVFPLLDTYTIFVPEKFDWELGRAYHQVESERARYTIQNRLENAFEVITAYLAVNAYEHIVLAGHSEGAYIVPVLYEKFTHTNIEALLLFAGGGLSFYERERIKLEKTLAYEEPFVSFPVDAFAQAGLRRISGELDLRTSEDIRRSFIDGTLFRLRVFREEPYPDSYCLANNTGMTERQTASFLRFHGTIHNSIRRIDIPTLFLHGEMDRNVVVESTRYVQDALPNNLFDFIYYPEMAHWPLSTAQVVQVQNDVRAWLAGVVQ